MTAKEVHAKAEEFNATLRADHPGFGGCVLIVDVDELSVQFLRNAFVKPIEGPWVGVYSEHQGFRIEHTDESRVMSLQQVPDDWWEKA